MEKKKLLHKCSKCGAEMPYNIYKGLCSKCHIKNEIKEGRFKPTFSDSKTIEELKEIYNAFKVLDNQGVLNFSMYDEFMSYRTQIIDATLKIFGNGKEVILETIRNHPVIRKESDDGYFYSHIFEDEIFKDKDWVGHCSACQKPIFKGQEGHQDNCSLGGLSWRGCKECSERNGYPLEVF